MAAAVACPRFSQNAWRRELCANCFKAKTEHAVVAPRPAPSRFAKPKKSILKGDSNGSKSARTVCFPAEESEVIGYDGGDVSSDDEEPPPPLTNGDAVDSPLYPEMSEEEDKDLQNLTRRNTDFNSENANLLIKKSPPPLPKTKQKENHKSSTPITINCTPFSPSTKPSNIPKSVNNKTHEAPKKTTIEIGKRNGTTPLVSVTPFGGTRIDVKAKNDVNMAIQESRIPRPAERRPPLGHEASAPLTAPALVKLTTTSPPVSPPPPVLEPPQEKPPEVIFASDSSSSEDSLEPPVFSRHKDNVECEPPAFLRHKDSVDLISPPQSPRLPGNSEERPAPIGKVSSTLTVTLKSPTSPPKESKRSPKLVEARSSALIRRWTVGERVLIQPRRPVLDAPEIVPLALQSSKSSLGLEPRELAGQPDGEDATTTSEPITSNNTIQLSNEKPTSEPQLKSHDDKPPTPPSSPLPDDEVDKPPMLPNSPPPTLPSHQRSILHDLASTERPKLTSQEKVATVERPNSLNLMTQVNLATEEIISTEVIEKMTSKETPKSINIIKDRKGTKARPKSMHQERAVDVPAQERPKSLNLATPPAPKSQEAPAVTPRSSFLHGAMLGRPQVPAKPASLLASVPAKAASLLANVTSKRFLNSSTSAIAVSTPQPPKAVESPTNPKPEEKSKSSIKKEDISLPCTPENKPGESTNIYETPKTLSPDIDMSLKPPFSTPKPKLGSYKKRQAPKPPTQPEDERTHTRNSSQDSYDELTRRDSITSLEKSPPTKKNNARFSLRRLLRLGKDERAMSPDSPSSPTSSPSPPGSPPIRPEIIHPSMLDGKEVQVVGRIQQSSSPTTPPPQNLSPSTSTPAGRPRPPPPPPRTLSLSGSASSSSSSGSSRPSRPPPPQSAQLLEMRDKATDPADRSNDEDAVYANLDLVKSRVAHGASKPAPSSNLRETSPEPLSSPASDDTDYETIQFSDGRMSRRRRSAVLGSLEENYGAVVGANHRALAQLVTSLCNLPLPANHSMTSLSEFASAANKEEDKNLALLQMLVTLKGLHETGVMNVSLEEFAVVTFSEPQTTEVGPRIHHDSKLESSTPELLQDIAKHVSQILLPSDTKLTSILNSKGLSKAISYLEFKIWGPELAPQDKEIAIQRWLDLERATALQNLAQNRTSTKLPISQELYLNFLVASSAIGLSRASLL